MGVYGVIEWNSLYMQKFSFYQDMDMYDNSRDI